MELFANIVDCIEPLNFFAKHSILGVSQGECASDRTKQKTQCVVIYSTKN